MPPFNNRMDPDPIPNLSSNHADDSMFHEEGTTLYQPQTFEKRDSASFQETKVKFEQTTMPDFSKTRSGNVEMPKPTYTEEKELPRPIADKDKKLAIDKKEQAPLSFSKSTMDPMGVNPVAEVFQNAETTAEVIEIEENNPPLPPKAEKKKHSSKKMPWIILLAIVIELLIIGVIYVIRDINAKEVVECTSSSNSEYFHAKITNTKRYTFKYGKITKLVDTTYYQFDSEEVYQEFKSTYANPPHAVVNGRVFVNNINDNEKSYEEKATYDYPKLRKKSTSKDAHNIVIDTDTLGDQINLIDYNITDIKIIYGDDYICK